MSSRSEKIVWVAAALIAVVGLWRWWQLPGYDESTGTKLDGAVFVAGDIPRSNELSAAWLEPEAQSAGREWIFETFTPPIVYFDAVTQRFTVLPPLAPAEEPNFGVELSSIEDQPYRLQYAGHHGVEGAYIVEIRDLESGRYYRGSPGTTFDKGAFAILDFRAERVVVQPKKVNRTPYIERTVRLLVEDFDSDETVELGRDALILSEPVVTLEGDDGSRSNALRIGDAWNTGTNLFRVASVDRESGKARIYRMSFDGSIEAEKDLSLVGEPTESEM